MEEARKTRRTSTGKCGFCGGTFGKGAITRHLQSCQKRQAVSGSTAGTSKLLHLVVEGRDLPEYWMHLEVPATAKLTDLDRFLRRTWLECCGHMSAFDIDGQRYYSSGARELEGRSMNVELGKVLRSGLKFHHEYDFGTTTELTLKVVSEQAGDAGGKSIRMLARNDPPMIPCQSCGKSATQVCAQCIYEGEGWLCDECANDHECGEEMLLPVVNSPRVGMCGYTG